MNDSEMHEEIRRAADLEAIREGIADAIAGRVVPLDEAFRRVRSNLQNFESSQKDATDSLK